MNEGTLLFVNFAAYSWLLLVPIVALEARELKLAFSLGTGRALAISGAANLASTLACTLAAFAAGWVLGLLDVIAEPQAGEGDAAALIALVPCFYLSVWTETRIGTALLEQQPAGIVRAAFVRANLLACAMLGIVPVVRFAKSALVNGRIIW